MPEQDFNTKELLNEHKKDISTLGEKVTKCYSSENYEYFQTAVEKIVSRYLKASVGWAIVVWITTMVGSMLLQKFTNIL